MNDAYNTPRDVLEMINENISKILFFKPFDVWEIGKDHNNDNSLLFGIKNLKILIRTL